MKNIFLIFSLIIIKSTISFSQHNLIELETEEGYAVYIDENFNEIFFSNKKLRCPKYNYKVSKKRQLILYDNSKQIGSYSLSWDGQVDEKSNINGHGTLSISFEPKKRYSFILSEREIIYSGIFKNGIANGTFKISWDTYSRHFQFNFKHSLSCNLDKGRLNGDAIDNGFKYINDYGFGEYQYRASYLKFSLDTLKECKYRVSNYNGKFKIYPNEINLDSAYITQSYWDNGCIKSKVLLNENLDTVLNINYSSKICNKRTSIAIIINGYKYTEGGDLQMPYIYNECVGDLCLISTNGLIKAKETNENYRGFKVYNGEIICQMGNSFKGKFIMQFNNDKHVPLPKKYWCPINGELQVNNNIIYSGEFKFKKLFELDEYGHLKYLTGIAYGEGIYMDIDGEKRIETLTRIISSIYQIASKDGYINLTPTHRNFRGIKNFIQNHYGSEIIKQSSPNAYWEHYISLKEVELNTSLYQGFGDINIKLALKKKKYNRNLSYPDINKISIEVVKNGIGTKYLLDGSTIKGNWIKGELDYYSKAEYSSNGNTTQGYFIEKEKIYPEQMEFYFYDKGDIKFISDNRSDIDNKILLLKKKYRETYNNIMVKNQTSYSSKDNKQGFSIDDFEDWEMQGFGSHKAKNIDIFCNGEKINSINVFHYHKESRYWTNYGAGLMGKNFQSYSELISHIKNVANNKCY